MAARTFFEGLEARAGSEGLAGIDNSFRFEIEGEGSWHVAVRDGKVAVTEGGDEAADATIRTSADVFEGLLSGRQNPAIAFMTGKVKVDGDMSAVMKLQNLLG